MRPVLHTVLFLLLTAAAVAAPALRRTNVYVQNPTTSTISFSYKAGGNDWQRYTLKPGYTRTFTSFAEHRISFDNGRRRSTAYKLTPGSTNYFQWSRGTLDLKHR